MKNRKRGFSLVELLIVLAVIAALIATITPVALNAIRKSKATQVAQNLKTLASALENAAYVNGTFPNTYVIKNASDDTTLTLNQLGRDIKVDEYAVYYAADNGSYTAVVAFVGEADIELVDDTLAQATESIGFDANTLVGTTRTELKDSSFPSDLDGKSVIYYRISFDVY